MAGADFEDQNLCCAIREKKESWNSPRRAILKHVATDIQD